MNLKVVGAGLPRTGTSSLRSALEELLRGPCCHMSAIPGHPFNLGKGWNEAIETGTTDWDKLMARYSAAVDWPASMFWRQLSEENPNALVLLSVREDVEDWWTSVASTILRPARMAQEEDWTEGRGLVKLLERFTGTSHWDDRSTMMNAYLAHNEEVRNSVPADRLLEWKASDGWQPICEALGLPVPEHSFPWLNKRSEWS